MEDIKTMLSKLSIEEKASLCSGLTFWLTKPVEKLGLPSVMMTDGPHGLRREVESGGGVNVMKGSAPSTCFPTAVTSASSWDRNLLYEIGKNIAQEAKDQGVSTVLGPGTNIKRSHLCGRNFEYFSEDPFLSGELSTSYVQGAQSQNVGTSLKHYCGNNQEHIRMSIDSKIDERALREIYLPAFENTVKRAQPQQIMCSYNKLNGTYLSDNKRFLTDILRNEWGFEGIVVSDWGAVNDRIAGIKAGMDLEMPGNGGINDRKIVKAVADGIVTEAELDAVCERMLKYLVECNNNKDESYKCDYKAHHDFARKAAAESSVLLKNEDSFLPLSDSDDVALIGKLAKHVRYQGSGSSRINPYNLVNIVSAMDAAGLKYEYADGYTLKGDGYDKKLLKAAVELAAKKQKVILVIGLTDAYESEGFDRSHMDLPLGHNKLVEEVLKVNPNVAVVLQGGSPVTMPWHAKVKSVLNTYLGGDAVGEATVDLLYGKVNPSGKLAETYPKSLNDSLAEKYFSMGPVSVEYRESIFVGYRWYDTAKKEVRFPFGHGLSYTSFEYSDIKLSADKIKDTDTLSVSFKITNTGKVDGAEIAQVYVSAPKDKVFMADKELKGFEKVFLKAGESKTVTVELGKRSFAFYNTAIADWHVLGGKYEILVGASSRDIKLTASVDILSSDSDKPLPDYRTLCPCYYVDENTQDISKEDFEKLFGDKLPENVAPKRGEFTVNSTITDIAIVPLGKLLKGIMMFGGGLVAGNAENRSMILNSIKDMPLRSFCGFSGGIMSMMSIEGLVDIFNKKKGGYRKLFAGFKKKNR